MHKKLSINSLNCDFYKLDKARNLKVDIAAVFKTKIQAEQFFQAKFKRVQDQKIVLTILCY